MDAPKPKRGLSALLSSTSASPAPAGPVVAGQEAAPNPVRSGELPIASIRPNPRQPRTVFEPQALNDLAASIKARGIIQPVVVRELRPDEVSGEVRYELIAGERRWRAAQMAGLSVVPAVIKQVFDDRDILLLSLVENLQRDDLNPIEEALAYDRLAKTFSLTHDQIADGVGKSRATVSNAIRMLELPSSIQDALQNRKLSIGHAKVLLAIPDPKIQTQLAAKAQAEDLTVRDLERVIIGSDQPSQGVPARSPAAKKNARGTRVSPPHVKDIEERLREHFGTKVTVEESLRKGRIIVEFYSVEDFGRITYLMGVDSETAGGVDDDDGYKRDLAEIEAEIRKKGPKG